MKQVLLPFLTAFLMFSGYAFGQAPQSTIKGQVLDAQSGAPLAGATVLLLDSSLSKGAFSDEYGNFRIEGVPIGRHSLQVSMLSYDKVVLQNLVLLSGKELNLEISMEEKFTQLDAVQITSETEVKKPNNEMATVSSRTISIEEAGRFSGSFQDPARMAQNFAGVSGASDDRNDIIIRGNSPTGVLWRLEGIDIPSPNHFSTLGTTGGPVSMLNVNNLKDSDFMSGAFPASYGNALAGVFDLKLRKGNSDKREYLGQVGFNGFEFGAEGPFKKGKRASYLVNYRYSMLAIAKAIGLEFGTGAAIPEYQDITFKLHFPTRKAGTINVFGIGGISEIEFLHNELGDNNLYSSDNWDSKFNSNTGVAGISHTLFLDNKTSSRLVLAVSGSQSTGNIDTLNLNTEEVHPFWGSDNTQIKYSANYKLNRKFSPRNSANIGFVADLYDLKVLDSVETNGQFRDQRNFDGQAGMLQAYAQWQYRLNEKLRLTTGLHSQHFLLNNSHAIEPRIGLRYQVNEKQSLNLGTGLHSQIQPINVYFVKDEDQTNSAELPNKNLDFSKSLHVVLGYDWAFAKNMRLKLEGYFQHLYNVPVDTLASSFSMLNAGRDFVLPDRTGLVNEGTGDNFGFELTVEKFFSKGYYFLFTTSLFQSTYTGSDEIERSTAFNGGYVVNALGGKEFKIGKKNTLGLDTKLTFAGGNRYTPIDLDASIQQNEEVRIEDQAFSEQYTDYFRLDVKLSFQMNMKKIAQSWSVDLTNLTGNKNIFQSGFNEQTGVIATTYQRGFFPNVQYKIFF